MHVSIIIPTRNRCDVLRHVLESLANVEDLPDDHEIIVVDNASTDGTRALVEHVSASRSKQAIRYVHERVPGLLSGRHRGALEARGDICAYLDDDVRLSHDWLMALKEAFGDPAVAMVGGPSSPLFEGEVPDWLSGFYCEDERGRYCGWLSLFDGGERIKQIDPCLVWGLNFSIRRQALVGCRGFHPDSMPRSLQRFQGDGETGLSLKARQAGLKAQYHPRVAVQHVVPASRLTVRYFEERARFQGVCDSYTHIRAARNATPNRSSWTDGLRKFARRVVDAAHAGDTRGAAVPRRTSAAYSAGYAFHQEEVRRDPTLLEWVLRDDYWDYRLPAGWEAYLNGAAAAR